MRAPARCDRER